MSDATVSPPPVGAVRRTKRQRRPTGAPPPLPRRITVTTSAWLLLVVVTVTGGFLAAADTPWRRAGNHLSTWLLRIPAAIRTPWLTHVAEGINVAVLDWHPVIGIAVVLLTIVFRRWRQLAVLLFGLFFLEIVGSLIYNGLSRPRPYGVRIIGSWDGYSAPATVVAALTFFGMGAVYCLVVPGRPRSYAKATVAVVVAAFCLSRLYLAVDHPDDVLFGLGLGVAIPVTAFRFFTPNEVFPVVYRRGRTAHVDVTGRRGAAIRQAVRDQLGLTVLEIKPVGLASSAGSMPLRLTVEGDPDQDLFAKLYTRGHVRADRWYKLWRTIRYGALEDEHPFSSVKQLTQYEDYVLRLLRDAGIRTMAPHGIVEITPESEYLLVSEFFTGAVEIGEAEVDDRVIDQGLLLIRKLWDAGVALAGLMLIALVAAVWIGGTAFKPARLSSVAPPVCGHGHSMILAAQAVPSSAMLPCIAALPSGWTADLAEVSNGRMVFWLDSDLAGPRAVTVTLTATCDTSGAVRVPSDQPGAARFERPLALQPRFMLVRMYTVAGGCITYQFSFATGAAPSLAIFVDQAVTFEPRSVLVDYIRRSEGLALCGRGAACPG